MKSSSPVDYSSHEGVYRALRGRGASGWSSDDEYAAMARLIAPGLPPVTHGNPPRVLELGSGAGNLSTLLADQGYDVTGVDISETAVAWARERAAPQRAAFRVDNVVELASCEGASFDAVVDGHCLHCIIGDDRARCLESVHRVLKPGGVFVVLTMCGAVVAERLRASFDPLTRVVTVDGRPTRYIGGAEAIAAEVERAGFDIVMARVEARKSADEQDDLILYASKRCPDDFAESRGDQERTSSTAAWLARP
jgi:SAM-dependent methyltransferase